MAHAAPGQHLPMSPLGPSAAQLTNTSSSCWGQERKRPPGTIRAARGKQLRPPKEGELPAEVFGSWAAPQTGWGAAEPGQGTGPQV